MKDNNTYFSLVWNFADFTLKLKSIETYYSTISNTLQKLRKMRVYINIFVSPSFLWTINHIFLLKNIYSCHFVDKHLHNNSWTTTSFSQTFLACGTVLKSWEYFGNLSVSLWTFVLSLINSREISTEEFSCFFEEFW